MVLVRGNIFISMYVHSRLHFLFEVWKCNYHKIVMLLEIVSKFMIDLLLF